MPVPDLLLPIGGLVVLVILLVLLVTSRYKVAGPNQAFIVTGIPEGGFGVVRVLVGGHSLQLNARADGAVEPGTEVYVTAVLSPTAVAVAPVHRELA